MSDMAFMLLIVGVCILASGFVWPGIAVLGLAFLSDLAKR